MSFYEESDGIGSSVYEEDGQESILSDSPDQYVHHHHHQDFDDSSSSSPSMSLASSLYQDEEGNILHDIFVGDLEGDMEMDDEDGLFVGGYDEYDDFEDEGPIELPPIQQNFGHIHFPRSPPIINGQSPIFPRRANPNQPVEVVDLTVEDSSPARGNQVINLISDSDEDQNPHPPRPAAPRRNTTSNLNNNNNGNGNNNNNNNNNNRGRPERPPQHHHHHHHHIHHHREEPQDNPPFLRFANLIQHLPMFGLFNNAALGDRGAGGGGGGGGGAAAAAADDLVFAGERNRGPPLPINIGMRLDYAHNAFRAHQEPAAPARPAHEAPPPARDGFTRDTGEDVIAICPSCDQELAYDPDGDAEADAAPPTPAKKPRSKKDKAEHHFFAVKACGHVYCKKCYDNRKPTVRNPVNVGFRPDPKNNKGKILCAVEDCESDVSNKAAWVGIFL